MRTIRQILFRLQPFLRRRTIESGLSEEIRTHLEMATEANLAAGMSPEEARYAALRASGGVAQAQERWRDERGIRWLEELGRDLRLAFRQLARTPGFTAVALLSLALGIGANTAVFSLVNAVLLRSLPVPNPQELRVLQWSGSGVKIPSSSGRFTLLRGTRTVSGPEAHRPAPGDRSFADAFAYPVYRSLREEAAGVAEIMAYADLNDLTVRAGSLPYLGAGMLVSDNFFAGLGVRPVLGRLFMTADEVAGADPVVVISWAWWEKHFARNPEVLGQAMVLNGRSYTVIGVLPREFHGVRLNANVGVYVPMAAQPALHPWGSLTSNDHWWMQVMARVRPGVSAAQLQTTLDTAFARSAAANMQAPRLEIEAGGAGPDWARDYYRRPLMVLFGVVATVILAACANLAGLSLARAASRRHECAVRAALGCGRWRLVRQSLTESLVLAGGGGLLGVAGAIAAQPLLARFVRARGDLAMDGTVLLFTLALTLLTALLAGLLPAWRSGAVDPLDGLKSGTVQARLRPGAGRWLVAAQIAFSVVLLTGAGLYARTFRNLVRIDPGFDMDHLLLVQLNPRSSGYHGATTAQFYEQVQEALRGLPGVQNVALVQFALLGGWSSSGSFEMPAHPPASRDPATWPNAHRLVVGEAFFETLGLPVILGRGFSAADADGAPRVAVVNEALARKCFAGEHPLGQVLKFGSDEWSVVGVARDAKFADIKQAAPPTVYFPFRQNTPGSTYFALRTAQAPLALVPAVRKTVAAIDANVPLADVTTQELLRDGKISGERVFATLIGVLSGLAVLLACIGLYGLLAYNVARRMPEFGIRSALGAQRGDIARPIVREALGLAAAGIAVGVPAAVALAQVIKHQLYGVTPTDPLTLVGVGVLLLMVAALAAWLPARRAAKVDPLVALRSE